MSSSFKNQNEDQNNNQHDHNGFQCGGFHMTILVGGGLPLLSKSFTPADSGTSLSAGPFNITNTSGAGFTVYGDYQNINFTVTNSTNNTNLVMHDISVDLAGNTINLGSGVNTVYGNIQDMSFTVSNTSVDSVGSTTAIIPNAFYDPITGNFVPATNGVIDSFGLPNWTTTYDVGINNVNVELGGNTISVGSGVNTIYGTLRDLNMSDTGGNAVTSFGDSSLGIPTNTTGTQVTVNTLIKDVTIDLTGDGVGNSIAAGNGVNTVFGDMRNFTITVGGAYANSTDNPNANASTPLAITDFTASPNIQPITDIQGLNFTVGDNNISLGNGVNTVYGDMQTLTINALPSNSFGYNTAALSGFGDQFNQFANGGVNGRSVVPYTTTPNFNSLNFDSNMITVGNGVNIIYGHLETLNLSQGGNNQTSSSPGDFVANGSPFDQSVLFALIGLPGFVLGSIPETNISASNIIMNGNTINAGVGINTIYGDLSTLQETMIGGTSTGTFPSSPGSSVYVPLNSFFASVFGFATPDQNAQLVQNVLTMAGNEIKAGLSGSSTNTIYGTMQDLRFSSVAGTGNQGETDNAQFGDVIVMGGTGHYIPGTYPGFSPGPNFSASVTGNNITAGNGVNIIYGDMRDFITTDSGGLMNGLNNPLGLNGQPITTNGPTLAAPFVTVNSDGCEFFMGNNHITTGNGVNTIYGGMRDLINVNGGVDNNGVITSNSSTIGIVENIPSGGTDDQFLEVDALISIAGNTITVGSGINTIDGSMRDLTVVEFGGKGVNIAVDSFAIAESHNIEDFISMGGNKITTGSGVNTIDGDFRNLDWSCSGGIDSAAPSGPFFEASAAAFIWKEHITMGANNITAGVAGVSSVNQISGDGEDINFSVVGGSASGNLMTWNGIFLNNLSMGHNHVDIFGSGTSTIYGDVKSIVWSATGGLADGSVTGGSFAEGQIYGNNVTMGGNVITDHGNGSDTIYGDAQTISFSVQGGTVTNPGQGSYFNLFQNATVITKTDAAAYMTDNTLTLAGNTIQGGSGNDVIYASLQNLSFSAHAGSGASGAGAYFSGTITYPNGGSSPTGLETPVIDTGNHITFGNDVVNGGAGNDTIIGSDALNLSGLDNFLQVLNTIGWSDNTLTGGTGADKFEFSLASLHNDGHLENQGHATITDFSTSQGDKLVFKVAAGVDLAAINADTVFTHPNVGGGPALDTVATFHDGSSITLLDVNIAAFSAANTVLVH